ncbi:oligopeptide transporter subunit; membrane component of ABC superfamily [[Clostridium] ultunense Esp]|nr:oligopeptide transporter subunit; membrane component of ABC superfamily [[Clostridium] ultunense Esp]
MALIILGIIILAVILAPLLTVHDPYELNMTNTNQPPSREHKLGTDELGRDNLSRVLHGGKVALQVGIFAVVIEVILGTLIGGIAGYYGGWVDNILMRITEVFMSFPFLPLVITISAVVGVRISPEQKMYLVMVILGVLSWPGLARIVRGQILSLREQEFVLAAKALGIRNTKIIWRHLIPNTVGYIVVNATIGVASAILQESALSFLGLGVAPPVPTWGNLIQYARDMYNLQHRPWLWIPPGLLIFATVMCINLIGDGLRDAIDPKS